MFEKKCCKISHSTHCGIVATKRLIQLEAWWPGFSLDVERWIRECCYCSENKQKNPVHLDTWQKEDKAWIRVHMEHAIIPNVGLFLVLMDACSGWPEIVNNRSAECTIDAVRVTFIRQGVPLYLVTDNAQEFCSETSINWLKKLDVHLTKHHHIIPNLMGVQNEW